MLFLGDMYQEPYKLYVFVSNRGSDTNTLAPTSTSPSFVSPVPYVIPLIYGTGDAFMYLFQTGTQFSPDP